MLLRLILLGVAATLGFLAPVTTAAASVRPNVIVILTDDQPKNTMVAMPRTNALIGSKGVTFTNAVASFPLCCPARATLLSGQYAHNTGVLGNGAFGGVRAFDDDRSVQKSLQQAGYRTSFVGKFLNGYQALTAAESGVVNAKMVPPYWNDWHGLTGDVDSSRFRLNDDGTISRWYRGTDPANYQTDVLASRVKGLLADYKRRPDQPFFLVLAPHAPHPDADWTAPAPGGVPFLRAADRHQGLYTSPSDPKLPEGPAFNGADPKKLAQFSGLSPLTADEITGLREEYRERLRALASVDESVASIVETLQANGELSSTLLVFTTDNGWLQGEHRIPQGKIKVYDPSAGVPLLMRGPGVPAGTTSGTAVTNADIGATIVDVAGATPSAPLDGESLLPIAQSTYTKDRAILLENASVHATAESIVPETFNLIGDPVARPHYSAVRTRRYLYVEYYSNADGGAPVVKWREMYDRKLDPEETRNLAYQEDDIKGKDSRPYAPQQARLARYLDKLRDCKGTGCHLNVSILPPKP